MNIRALSDWKPEDLARTLHHKLTAARISRRQFARVTAGTALAGALQPALSGSSCVCQLDLAHFDHFIWPP